MSCAARVSAVAFALLALVFVLTQPVRAQWKPNGVPVCSTVGSHFDPVVIPDGSGGIFAAWSDTRSAVNVQDIYVQRVDPSGYPLWAINGVAPDPTAGTVQLYPALVEDGAGGVIVIWSEGTVNPTTIDIYAQRFDELGNALWAPGGIVLCDAADAQVYVSGTSDGSGGAFVAWQDFRYGASDPDVLVNRIDAGGNLTWGTSGLSVCSAVGVQQDIAVVSDGLGGCIIAWSDFRVADFDIYAQRISAANFLQWAANGVAMTGAANDQTLDAMVADNLGGAILVWQDARPGTHLDVYAQRVSGAGSVQWAINGTPIGTEVDNQYLSRLAADGAGGAVVVWTDGRDLGSLGIYADYIDGAGATQWAGGGKPIAAFGGSIVASNSSVTSVGDGVVVAWRDDRSGSFRVYAQRLTFDGVEMWPSGGVQVTDGTLGVDGPLTVADGNGGAILAWQDYRNYRGDVYAQRLEPTHGEWGRPEPLVWAADDNPGDQGGYVELEWFASDRDRQPYTLISYYSTWRATDGFFFATSAAGGKGRDEVAGAVRAAQERWPDAVILTRPDAIAADFKGSAIWVEERPEATPWFWEWMSNQAAAYQPGYSYLAPTRADSSGAGPAQHYFKVIAHTWDQYVFWESQYTSGYSVDNLAPGAPLLLVAARVGNYVRLDWNPSGLEEPDFSQYVVYRATSSGVTPVPLFLLGSTTEETLWDQNAPAGTPYYYIVTARDVHGNQSLPSNEANVDGTATGVGDDVPALTSLQVRPNMPNPFGDATTLRVGLPDDGDIALEVYDVAGRRVFARTYPSAASGWRDITFDGRDATGRALPGGVYFYRVHAAGATVTRKMVLMR